MMWTEIRDQYIAAFQLAKSEMMGERKGWSLFILYCVHTVPHFIGGRFK